MTDCSWEPPPADLRLSDGEVHIWRVVLDVPEAQVWTLRQTLADDELVRAAQLRFPHLSQRFIVARGTLRAILAQYLNVLPGALRFGYTRYGKPFLAATPGHELLSFNLAHAGGLGVYAVAHAQAVGVDVEAIRRDVDYEQIAAHFFSPAERQALRGLPATQQRTAFFTCWTRKEAYIKARGQGLSLPLDLFSVSLSPHEPARLLHAEENPEEVTRWSLWDLAPGPGYVAALAIEGHAWRLACWQWPPSN